MDDRTKQPKQARQPDVRRPEGAIEDLEPEEDAAEDITGGEHRAWPTKYQP